MYEYTTTYYNVEYFVEEKDPVWRGAGMPVDPNPESFSQDALIQGDINRMGRKGWRLVSVQPLLRACYHEGVSIGYTLTAGYYFIWQRQL